MSRSILGLIVPPLQNAGETGVRESLRLMDLPEPWVLFLVLTPLLLAVTWLGYGRERIATTWRFVLGALRGSALVLMLLVLFRPVLVQRREEVRPAEVVIAIDDSASMQRKDAYTGAEAPRAALQSFVEGRLADAQRLELARGALERELVSKLEAKGYVTRLFAFSDSVSPISSLEGLTGRGSATHIGDAVHKLLASHRGRHVTDIVLVSDGRSNGGAPVRDAARAASGTGIPVHTVVIGDTRPERNAVLELVESPPNALEGDEIAVVVRVLGRGIQVDGSQDGPSRTPIFLEELHGDDEGTGRVVAEESVALSEAGERVLLVAPPGPADTLTNERRFRVHLPPLTNETLVDDNTLEFSVHVAPEKVRVLYVDGYPRWDYRQLALNVLKRSDKNIQFQAFLLSATPDFLQESSEDTPPLQEVPTDRETLLRDYDVIILGDVNPFAISPDPRRCEEFLASLVEFVERGGGLLLQAGEYDNPRSFLGTPLEDLMPVVLDPSSLLGFQGDTTRESHPTLEDPAHPHEVVRLHPDLETNRALWEDVGGLYGFFWYYPVGRSKPASEVLLRHPSDENNHGRHPILTAGYFPAGRTMFLAIDSTWRWRFRYGNRYIERFWRNAIRWLALGRLKSGDRRFRVETTRTRYSLGERVPLEARVLDEDFHPSREPFQTLRWQPADGESSELHLSSVEGRDGLFRGTLEVDRPGLYRAWIDYRGQRIAGTEFEVVLPSRENADPSPDPGLLRELAVLSGGRSTDLTHLAVLLEEFPGDEERREPISTQLDDVWDHWATLLLAVGLLAAEWILRKRVELV